MTSFPPWSVAQLEMQSSAQTLPVSIGLKS